MITVARRAPAYEESPKLAAFLHTDLDTDLETQAEVKQCMTDHAAFFLPAGAVVYARDNRTGGFLAGILNTEGVL